MNRIATFDDWTDCFREWQKDIGYDADLLGDYRFETRLGDLHSEEIEFGDYRGGPKWQRAGQIPNQAIRDALLTLIVYQGDTEFASVEQQKNLLDNAPTEYDRQALIRVNSDEMRHGWQMCYLLVNYFGDTGKLEARKLLERRANDQQRLLGSFNQPVHNWLDFFTYTQFVDRDGKFQLTMLSHSAFAPLARSVSAMLKEEFFHMFTGNTAYDLFGTDRSSSAQWAYVWGLKGRFDEAAAGEPADRERLNESARAHYLDECRGLVDNLNRFVPEGELRLRIPDVKFNRSIGDHAGRTYGVDGDLLSDTEYEKHLSEALPGAEDERVLDEIFEEKDWVLQMN